MSDESDAENVAVRKRKRPVLSSSDSDDASPIIPIRVRSRPRIEDSDSSDSDLVRRKRRVPRVTSDSESSSSGSDIVVRRRSSTRRALSESEDSDINVAATGSKMYDSSSSDSGDETEKCAICLKSFKDQPVGSPEVCNHSYCLICLQEWSKNMNTCPVDRLPYQLILVRDNFHGKVYEQIPVEKPEPQVEPIEEFETFCEICGRNDREDRMLLCDGCDLGFHLECLTPPLDDVPVEQWFCSECYSSSANSSLDFFELELLVRDASEMEEPRAARRINTRRIIPRTRQSERVRARVISHRNNLRRNAAPTGDAPMEGSSSAGVSAKKRKKKKKSKKKKFRVTYEIDEATGRRIAIKTTIQCKRNSRDRTRRVVPKTVKKRLAVTLGMCANRQVAQSAANTGIPVNSGALVAQRNSAGIPTLHLFGQRDELDYFSESDTEVSGSGINVLVRRRPNMSDVALMRRAARRKAIAIPTATATGSSVDLLGSILDSQSQFHSRNSILSLNRDGSVKVESKKDICNNNDNRINLNSGASRVRQTPYSSSSTSDSTVNNSNNSYNNESREASNVTNTVSTTTSMSESNAPTQGAGEASANNDYDSASLYMYDTDKVDQNSSKKKDDRSQTSDSEVDIYSDIEVSTSKAEDIEMDNKIASPPHQGLNLQSDDDENNSDGELVIDTEKLDEKSGASTPVNSKENKDETASSQESKEEVSSTVDCNITSNPVAVPSVVDSSSSALQSQRVQSSTQAFSKPHVSTQEDEDDDSDNECPNFSIYSTESINLAKTTDLSMMACNQPESQNEANADSSSANLPEVEPSPVKEKPEDAQIEQTEQNRSNAEPAVLKRRTSNTNVFNTLYSDSEDENVIKTDSQQGFNDLGDIRNMTEDISEEERSYTPCLDEKESVKEGLEGLDTEMISDEEKNDFDESHELKTVSDGDALEINAKESELDFTKPEDYEEGEIVDKLKAKKAEESAAKVDKEQGPEKVETETAQQNKENESNNADANFKKISKSNKERHYRDKERGDRARDRSKSKDRHENKSSNNKREKKKEKRKEIERYDVRSIIADKPRRMTDQFGRDIKRSISRSSKSCTPPPRRSPSRDKRSHSRDAPRKRRGRSRDRHSISRSRSPEGRKKSPAKGRRSSRSGDRRRSRSRNRKRASSLDKRSKNRSKKSPDRPKKISKKNRSRSRRRSRSVTPRRRRNWDRRHSKGRTPTLSRSTSPIRNASPSWTPPYGNDNHQSVRPHNLTVILPNDANKKKKEKRKKNDKRTKDTAAPADASKKRRKRNSPNPSKEVFASGDNILVSVSFNKENEERDVSKKRKKDSGDDLTTKRMRKEKEKRTRERRKVKNQAVSSVKPVAIIDLDRSPFKEITPSPKDVIVLTDSENDESNALGHQKAVCDSSQQVLSPERLAALYTGPKTPPEPQVKFSLNSKQPQLRVLTNPLHEPDEHETEIDPQTELEQRLNDVMHKGPNTPPEPPNSPPSSPDAYDPFDPTKSRSPTPEPATINSNTNAMALPSAIVIEEANEEQEKRIETVETTNQTPKETSTTATPPVADIQPADSQSSVRVVTPEKSPENAIGVVINQVTQAQTSSIFPTIPKPIQIPSTSSIITSTATSTSSVGSKINILNSTILQPSALPSLPRIPLPIIIKTNSPVKVPPVKPSPAKTTSKASSTKAARKSFARTQNGNDVDPMMDFESPYSPGSSDYEDLFEPPPDTSKPSKSSKNKSDGKAFDNLFGSPSYNPPKKSKKYNSKSSKHKTIGVKLDEDHLRILDEVPNSAVEMLVKDKFLKKLNRQERVVEEVKLVLKPHYNKKRINKEEYKDILRRAVPKICHNRSGEINPKKIQNLVEAYVKKIRHSKKVTSSSSVNPQKV